MEHYIANPNIESLQKLKWFGIDRSNRNSNVWLENIEIDGYKMNMNDINAAFGLAQLEVIEPLERTYQNGKMYDLFFNPKNELMTSNDRDINRSSYWAYPIKVNNRKELTYELSKYEIESRQHILAMILLASSKTFKKEI